MNTRFTGFLLTIVIAALLATGCGESSSPNANSGGMGGTGVQTQTMSVGAVTQMGSVYVNGVRYDTAGSNVTVDDNQATEAELKVGQVIRVNGTMNDDGVNGTADSVMVETVVNGPVDIAYNPDTRALSVLGQVVQITNFTVIDDSILEQDPANLALGNELKIHGHVRNSGSIEATLIERANPALTEYRLIGFVGKVRAKNFDIGNLTIVSITANMSEMVAGGPVKGQFVEVRGLTVLVDGELIATKVEPAGVTETDMVHVEMEAYVTELADASNFTLCNMPVTTDAETTFSGGLPDDIEVGIKMEVEGELVGGVLQATRAIFRHAAKVDGVIASFGAGTMSILGLSGLTIMVDGLTNGSAAIGEYAHIRGYKSGPGALTATSITSNNSNNPNTFLQAPVEDKLDGISITLLGVTIDTTTAGFEFKTRTGQIIDMTSFYDSVELGTVVKSRGIYDADSASIMWNLAIIQD